MEELNRNQNRLIPGIFLLIAGGTLLAYKMGAPLPWWLFSWKMFLIALGVFLGFKHSFRNPSWFILIIIGTIFLLGDISAAYNFKKFIAPIILLALGFFFILKPSGGFKKWKKHRQFDESNGTFSIDDTIESINIFSGSKKRIISKNFKGGETVNIMGGTELNFIQADINGKIPFESVNIMGGTKLIIPSNWGLQSEVVSIFGGVDDKRITSNEPGNPDKTIVLTGVNVFGGIEIKSY